MKRNLKEMTQILSLRSIRQCYFALLPRQQVKELMNIRDAVVLRSDTSDEAIMPGVKILQDILPENISGDARIKYGIIAANCLRQGSCELRFDLLRVYRPQDFAIEVTYERFMPLIEAWYGAIAILIRWENRNFLRLRFHDRIIIRFEAVI
jgi:hypothetical protein